MSPKDRGRFDQLVGPGGEGNDKLASASTQPPIGDSDIREPEGKFADDRAENTKDARPTNGRLGDFYQRLENREGRKFTNDPDDPGGPTKLGVRKKTLAAYHASKGGRAEDIPTDVRDLKPEQAEKIYGEFYYKRYRLDEVKDRRMAEQLLDISVNPGPGQAARWAQAEINRVTGASLKEDGTIGSKTLATLNGLTTEQRREVTNGIAEKRERFYRQRAEEEPKLQKYLQGWIDRAREFRE